MFDFFQGCLSARLRDQQIDQIERHTCDAGRVAMRLGVALVAIALFVMSLEGMAAKPAPLLIAGAEVGIAHR